MINTTISLKNLAPLRLCAFALKKQPGEII